MMALVAAASVLATSALGQVYLRGGAIIDDPIVTVTDQGVEVAGQAPRVIGWDRVRAVNGALAEEAAAFQTVADKAWRARTRLSRGDVALALPLYEELFDAYQGTTGPTALAIAEGLLQCRLTMYAQAAAVEPWLEALRNRRAGVTIPDEHSSVGPLDEETGLAIQLPPIWLHDDPIVISVNPATNDDPVVVRLAQLYQRSASDGGVGAVEQEDSEATSAVGFVNAIVESSSVDEVIRDGARRRLRAALARQEGTWREAWIRAALGQSYLLEPDVDDRRQGMIHLLHLPARFADSQPFLAGVGLAIVADELRKQGDAAGAERLIRDLSDQDALHPGLPWLERRQNERLNATAPDVLAHKEHL